MSVRETPKTAPTPVQEPPPDQASGEGAGNPFLGFLERVRTQIDQRLEAVLSAHLAEIGRYGSDVQTMLAAGKDLVLRGGKRFRAALCAAAHQGVSAEANAEPSLDAGVALELLQAYLLIQDDWMDGDLERRGGPSVHAALMKAFGDAHLGASSAILSGDYLMGLAVQTLAAANAPPERVARAVQLFCRVHNDVVIGQQLDMLGRAGDVEAMHTLKTGSYTVRGPLLLGAVLAGAGEPVLQALEGYAHPVGVAFQLRDDLLGMFGKSQQTGKPEGSDLRAGKRTALIAEAGSRLDGEGRALLAKVFGVAEAGAEDLKRAAEALEACGARKAVETRLGALCDEAEALASRLPLEENARVLLKGAAAALRMSKDDSAQVHTSRLSLMQASAVSEAAYEGRAFGKVILLGEHAVVYGAPALAAGLSIGAHALARRLSGSTRSELQFEGHVFEEGASDEPIARAFAALLKEVPIPHPVQVRVTTELPIGGGLGSSAALGIAIARAISAMTREEHTRADEEEARVLARATAWERVFHGNPSGIDTAVALRGGFVRFSRREGSRVLKPRAPLHLCIGWSGESSSTKAMVDSVARLKERHPDVVDRTIAGVEALVENAIRALLDGDIAALGKLMDLNQMLLAGIFVSTESIERMCALARGAGALGAKLTGSGGGGSVIALLPDGELDRPRSAQAQSRADAILDAWEKAGFKGFRAKAGLVEHTAKAPV